ncbi:hypothetical protein R5W24_006395 [Gemmata sp. JC717]|uniref:hypothetical protein n=1 Tax=Gemmata algarum TaxID=2975278 RepID=UPI0021BAA3D2|nr:hypothetical protein [Gemmata algarum]MDY3557208.1 hypothetical protein [Gemmata algarum]
MTAAMEDAEIPQYRKTLQTYRSSRATRDTPLRDLQRELRETRPDLADVDAARDFLARGIGEVTFAIAESILEAGRGQDEAAAELRADSPAFESKAFMRKLGLPDVAPRQTAWTAELISRGTSVYAGYTGWH